MKQPKVEGPGDAENIPGPGQAKLRVPGLRKLDYLSLTLKEYTSPDAVMESFEASFVPVAYGRFGYRKMAMAQTGGLSVMWDGAMKNMGVHVQISGKGCENVERYEGFDSWRDWIGRWQDKGAKITRLDLAVDDISGGIDFETVYGQVRDGVAMTRVKSGDYRLRWDPKRRYQTLYVGRREADTLLRCYDKGMQLGHDHSWLRFEFEYKFDKADGVAKCLVDEGWDKAIGVGRSFIEFKDPRHKVSEKTRQRPAKWWAELMDASKHVVRVTRDKETSLMKAYGWLSRQASPVLAVIAEHEGGDLPWLVELAKEGKTRWNDRHRKMLMEGM